MADFTLLELEQKTAELAQRVTYKTDGTVDTYDAVFLAQAGVWLQLSEIFLSEIYDYWIELQDTHNFSSIIGQEAYDMPSDFDKPLRIYDLTNKKKITIITEEIYSDGNIANIANGTTGTPDKARLFGVKNRLKQLKLGLIPNAVNSYRILHKKKPAGMTVDTDQAFIAADRYLIFDAYGFALKQDKEDDKANFAWQKSKEALQALLSNQMGNLGPDYINKVNNAWTQSHRT